MEMTYAPLDIGEPQVMFSNITKIEQTPRGYEVTYQDGDTKELGPGQIIEVTE